MRLVVHPLGVWALVSRVVTLDPLWAKVAVIEAALPAAATVFVVAQRYEIYVEEASSVVLFSTRLSVVSVSLLLAFMTAG